MKEVPKTQNTQNQLINNSKNSKNEYGSEFFGFEDKIKPYNNYSSPYEYKSNEKFNITQIPIKSSGLLSLSFIEPIPKQKLNDLFGNLKTAIQTNTAEDYQKNVLADSAKDPSITDYSVAYKRLVQERNKPWKLNPSDIADFYLLAGYIGEHEVSEAYQEDSTYLAVTKAKEKISNIGRRLLVALAHEQLDEYDRFAAVKPDSVPEELQKTIREHYQKSTGQEADQETADTQPVIEQEINAYLADFNAIIEQHAGIGKTIDIFTNEETNTMFGHALTILESQQRGRWQVMAKAMRALHDNSIPMSEFVQSITTTDDVNVTPEMEETLEGQREIFLVDRLLNYIHNTGTMSARITNYFPRAASLLLAHGLPGHADYLLYYSRLGYGTDTLGREIQKYGVRGNNGHSLVKDLTMLMETQSMPREYKYAMLLEFGDEGLHEAVQESTRENITPSKAYTLLQIISHHDGHSKGRLRQTK